MESSEALSGDSDWSTLSATGAIPDGVKYIGLALVLNGHGEAWFDSVSLKQIQSGLGPYATGGKANLVLTNNIVQEQFFGFGIQNDPYLFNQSINPNITQQDIDLIDQRISQLRPALVRVFFDPSWWDSSYDTPMVQSLVKTLQIYNGIGSEINLSMQTWGMGNLTDNQLLALTPKITGLLTYLIRTENLTHIHYLSLHNEPNEELKVSLDTYARFHQMMAQAISDADLQVTLVGVDDFSWNYYQQAVPKLQSSVQSFSIHEYSYYEGQAGMVEDINRFLDYTTANGGGKPVIAWEFGLKGVNVNSSFTPGEITPGVLIIDSYEPMLNLSEDALYGMYQGVAGFSYFEAYDLFYGRDTKMTIGLWAYKDEGWRIRPLYYMYGLLTRLTMYGAQIIEVSSPGCDEALPAIAVRNPDGTQTVYIINPTQSEVSLQLSGLSNEWKPKRYLLTEPIITDLIGKNALFADGTDASIISDQLNDSLPPLSMVTYSDEP